MAGGRGADLAPTVVTFTFDDTFANQAAAMEVLERYGMPATLYVNSKRIDKPRYLTKAQLKAYQAAGHEIAAHTVSHANLTAVPPTVVRREVCQDRVRLTAMGFRVTSFSYPFGSTDAEAKRVVEQCGYNSGRGVGDLRSPGSGCRLCATANTIPPVDRWKIYTNKSIDADLNKAKIYVTQAEEDIGGWVPLVFHHICDGCAANSMDLETFSAFVEWLSKRPSSTEVKTVHQVIGGAAKPVPRA
jgi:peptidoglycan/xylan/chitin deacetylase (PgdA/CDA1 family)